MTAEITAAAVIPDHFHAVGGVDEFLENEFRIVELDGRSVGVVLTKNGFYAVNNTCPHQGAAICEGRVSGTMTASDPHEYTYSDEVMVASCPWHRWEFELDTGRSYGQVTNRKLLTFQVLVQDGQVYVAGRKKGPIGMTSSEFGALIDVEQHVLVPTLDALLPYVPSSWQEKLVVSEFSLPPTGPHPGVEIERRQLSSGIDPDATALGLPPEVTAALLSAPQTLVTTGWLGHEMAATFHQAVNDYLIERWLPAEPRFHLAASVSVHDIATAVAEVRRVAAHDGVAAVITSLIAINMGHRHYHPLYEVCQELDLPLIVHPGGFEGQVSGPAALGGVGPRTPEETFALLPQVAMSNVSSLIFDGVFTRYPGLRVVFAGFGYGWVPPVLWRTDAEWRGLRVEVPWLVEAPSEVAARNISFVVDGACDLDKTGAWELAQMLPEQTLMYGSDQPYVSNVLPELDRAPAHLQRRLRFENAAATFPRLRAAAAV